VTALREPNRVEEDHAARAEARMAELRGLSIDPTIAHDKLYVDPAVIPDGWVYNWKCVAVLNKIEPQLETNIQKRGWTPVPSKRHPDMLQGTRNAMIEIDGLRLYERPKAFDDDAKMHERRVARDQILVKERQLAAAPPGTMSRTDDGGKTHVKISKGFESVPIPKD
jgi:hypothetical protein